MASGVRETKWVVTIDGNAKEASAETVDALKAMAAEFETNKKALGELNTALKASGKGNAEVTKKIKSQIETLTARQAVVTADAAKHGLSVQAIIKNAKREASERERAAKKIAQAEKDRAGNQARAFSMLGGRLGALRNKLLEYKDVAGENGGKGALLKAGLVGAAEGATMLAVGAAAAAVAVGVVLAAGIATATVALTKWVVLSANARQQSRLQMEAWVRTGANARNLADQIDELGKKVPTSTEELSKLAIGLRQAGLRGGPLVDSLNAIGQASSALGDGAAGKLQTFLTRYQRMGVMQINPMEMLGTGLDFDDVAGALAEQMGTSIEKARAALATGRVKLADGAKAMRKAVEDKFSGLNLRKLSDLSTVSEQFGKKLSALTKDVNLEPITRFLERIFKSLDESTVTGQALKSLFEGIAQAFGTSLDKNGDWIEYGLKEAVIVALDLATEMVLVKNRIEDAFNDGRTAAEKFNSILDTIKASLKLVAGAAVLAVAPLHGVKWMAEGASGLIGAGKGAATAVANTPAAPGAATPTLPAHAAGGIVTGISGGIAETRPLAASGEGLASVGVGEAIVPAAQVRRSGGGSSVTIGDIIVQSDASDPAAVAKEVVDNIVEKIIAALEVSNAQLGVNVMAFSVAIDHLVVSTNGVSMPVPADKTTLGPPKLKRNWDVKPGFGIQGAFCVYTGEGLAVFDVTFEFWDEAKEALWDQFANLCLTAPKGKRPSALGVYHPILAKPPFRIENVQVTEIEGWSLVTPGKWQTRLTLLQYRPPAPFVPQKTEPVVPAVEKKPPERPKTAQDFRTANSAARMAYAAGGAKSLDGFKPPYPGY